MTTRPTQIKNILETADTGFTIKTCEDNTAHTLSTTDYIYIGEPRNNGNDRVAHWNDQLIPFEIHAPTLTEVETVKQAIDDRSNEFQTIIIQGTIAADSNDYADEYQDDVWSANDFIIVYVRDWTSGTHYVSKPIMLFTLDKKLHPEFSIRQANLIVDAGVTMNGDHTFELGVHDTYNTVKASDITLQSAALDQEATGRVTLTVPDGTANLDTLTFDITSLLSAINATKLDEEYILLVGSVDTWDTGTNGQFGWMDKSATPSRSAAALSIDCGWASEYPSSFEIVEGQFTKENVEWVFRGSLRARWLN